MRTAGADQTERRIGEFAATMLARAAEREGSFDPWSLKKYLVVSTPRTGSSMFCKALENSGLGRPVEWFNELYMLAVQRAMNVDALNLPEYVRLLLLGTGNPELGVFGVNVHVTQYRWLKARGFDLFDLQFDRVYYLERKNKAKQAYSIAKSEKTGFWSREAEIEAGYEQRASVEVTAGEFCRALTSIADACDFAEDELASRVNRTFNFEQMLSQGLESTVNAVVADLKLDGVAVDASIPTEQQSSDRDRENLRSILDTLGFP